MVNKVVVGGGAAAVLSIGVLIGGLTTGLVGAHPLHQTAAQQAQATPQPSSTAGGADGETADGPDAASSGAEEAPVAVPAGSITADQATQDATAYVQQTAPYSSQGLQFHTVTADTENGTVIYTVGFTNGSQPDVEVLVGTQGKVLGIDSGSQAADASGGQDQTNGPDQAAGGQTQAGGQQEQEDGPSGQPEAPGTSSAPTGTRAAF